MVQYYWKEKGPCFDVIILRCSRPSAQKKKKPPSNGRKCSCILLKLMLPSKVHRVAIDFARKALMKEDDQAAAGFGREEKVSCSFQRQGLFSPKKKIGY